MKEETAPIQTTDLVARIRARPNDAPIPTERLLDEAADEIERLRTECDKFERAWNEVSDRYEALLNQMGATDA